MGYFLTYGLCLTCGQEFVVSSNDGGDDVSDETTRGLFREHGVELCSCSRGERQTQFGFAKPRAF